MFRVITCNSTLISDNYLLLFQLILIVLIIDNNDDIINIKMNLNYFNTMYFSMTKIIEIV